MKITTTMYAHIQPGSTVMPQDLQTEKGVRSLAFFRDHDKYWAEQGYTYVGVAEVTVEVPDLRELVDHKVEALRQQEVSIRAEATAKCTAIEGQIQNLLAIEYTSAPVEQQGAEA